LLRSPGSCFGEPFRRKGAKVMKKESLIGQSIPIFCGITGAALTTAMAMRTLALEHGNEIDHLAVFLIMVFFMALSMWLLWIEYKDARLLLCLAFPVAAAFLLRTLCLDYVSEDYRMFLSQWTIAFQENGGFKAISMNIGNYNVPYLYFIAAISYTDFPDLYAYKLFSIFFDVVLAWGCLRLVRVLRPEREKDLAPAAAFVLALLLPTVILNGSYWGQCDVIYGSLAVHAVASALDRHGKSSIALMAVAFSFKLQSIFLLPLWGVLWLSRKIKFRELWVFPGVYALTMLPAVLLGKPLKDILGIYVSQMGTYSSLSLNAPSVFEFVPYGIEVNRALMSTLGIIAAFALACTLLLIGLTFHGQLEQKSYFLMAVILAIGVPFFLPHMHERYFFMADVLTACWACIYWKKGIPACELAVGSSLLSYLAYLSQLYNAIPLVNILQSAMTFRVQMMLIALVWTISELAGTLSTSTESRLPAKG